ncbi:MAG: DUF1585 domain-containing protein [Polyangiaceae bacterium]|nr:DUF1585 domain-containing protein [Polyangiaceae bacterium]
MRKRMIGCGVKTLFPALVLLSALVSPVAAQSPASASSPTDESTQPTLSDYRRFRALTIDLLGRMPTRSEVADFEKGRNLEAWVDNVLQSGQHAGKLTRVYLDLLRLETPDTVLVNPASNILRRTQITGPTGKPEWVYFRRGQRRVRPETDGEFCLTERETGLKVALSNEFSPKGKPIRVSQTALNAATVIVKPWWLYKDARSPKPTQRYGEGWAAPSTFHPVNQLLVEPDGTKTTQVRVCREEASVLETGTIFASGRNAPVDAQTLGRQSNAPADSPYAREHKGEAVACRSTMGFAHAADCGCGSALEACVPGDANSKNPNAFLLPSRGALGVDLPLDEVSSGVSGWNKIFWEEEVRHTFYRIFAEDRDFRELVQSPGTWVNGPLAQFYRFVAPSMAGVGAKGFAPNGATLPMVDPASIPTDLSPHDTNVWERVGDRGPRASGIFTTAAFLSKYASRRARAAAVYTTFLCRSFVAEKIQLAPSMEPDLTVRSGCSTCHITLEPLAAYFTRTVETDLTFLSPSAFAVQNDKCALGPDGKLPYVCSFYYDPALSTSKTGILRGAFGATDNADEGPRGLGREIAQDDRFGRCAVMRIAGALLGRDLTPADEPWVDSLTLQFVQGGYRARNVVREVLLSKEYTGNGFGSASAPREVLP